MRKDAVVNGLSTIHDIDTHDDASKQLRASHREYRLDHVKLSGYSMMWHSTLQDWFSTFLRIERSEENIFCWEALMRFKTITRRAVDLSSASASMATPSTKLTGLSGDLSKKESSDIDDLVSQSKVSQSKSVQFEVSKSAKGSLDRSASMAQYVYDNYLSPAAELQIAMDGTQLREIRTALETGQITSSLFEAVETTCERAMTDSRSRFYESVHYLKAVNMLATQLGDLSPTGDSASEQVALRAQRILDNPLGRHWLQLYMNDLREGHILQLYTWLEECLHCNRWYDTNEEEKTGTKQYMIALPYIDVRRLFERHIRDRDDDALSKGIAARSAAVAKGADSSPLPAASKVNFLPISTDAVKVVRAVLDAVRDAVLNFPTGTMTARERTKEEKKRLARASVPTGR
jgi:hypothetical protein